MGPLADRTGLVHMDSRVVGQQVEESVRSGQALQAHKGPTVDLVPAPSRVQLAHQLRWVAVRDPCQRRSLGPRANPRGTLGVSIQHLHETHRDISEEADSWF